MNSNYIPRKMKQNQNIVSAAKAKKQTSIAIREKKSAIYAAFLFLLIMTSLTVSFLGQNIFIVNISITVFIISCLLLIKISGQTKQY